MLLLFSAASACCCALSATAVAVPAPHLPRCRAPLVVRTGSAPRRGRRRLGLDLLRLLCRPRGPGPARRRQARESASCSSTPGKARGAASRPENCALFTTTRARIHRARERRPDRLADVALVRTQALLESPVGRDGRQHAAAAVPGRVDDHGAVRRKARRLVRRPSVSTRRLRRLEVQRGDAVAAAVERHHGQRLAVRRQPRPRVVAVRRSAAAALRARRAATW